MKNAFFLILFFLMMSHLSFGQEVKGYVRDAETKETLAGVNVYYKDQGEMRGVVSDANGYYELKVKNGRTVLSFSYLGYETITLPVRAKTGESLNRDIALKMQSNLMDEVIVSVGRYEQKLSDITVSMDLLKSDEIIRQSPKNLSDVLKTVPGVDIIDSQPSIRGGTGWTYGVGSRCLVLVDGLTVLTPGTGEINWNMVPIERAEQVEVVKGASSILYGSSALNGMIHVKTKRPSEKPETIINLQGGIYGTPHYADTPFYGGVDISHTRRIKNFDLSVGANTLIDDGYRENNYNRRVHLGANLTYNDPKKPGLNYGANFNYLYNDYTGFFMWRSPEEYYVQSPMANMGRRENTFFIDPFLNYTNSEKGTTHRFRGRFFYRASKIISHSTDKTLIDILDNMGVSVSSITETANLLENWQTTLLPTLLTHVPEVMNGSYSGLMDDIIDMGSTLLPTATSADLIDLMSWIMGHTPFPDTDNLGSWLVDALEPTEESDPGRADRTYSYNLDYQYSKKFDNSQLTVGGTFEHLHVDSETTGEHSSDNLAAFLQYDHKFWDRLNLSVGLRVEYYRVDEHYREAETDIFGLDIPIKPVFRGGLNYQLGDDTYIRGSFGQGYRFPSVTEKFIIKDIGGVGAYPNLDLKAERGYNLELGIKQRYEWGNLKGFFDAAGYYTRYKDMIEFRFGAFNGTTYEYIDSTSDLIEAITSDDGIAFGAQFTNVENAEIYGVDLSLDGTYDFNPDTRLNYTLGYVFTNPIDMDAEERQIEEEANDDPLAMRAKSNDSKYLKYRQKHTFKAVLDLEWKRFNAGTNMTWKSKTLAVDYFIVDEREKDEMDLMDYARLLLYGNLHDYWIENNTGFFTMDVRAGVKVTDNLHLQALVNNVWDNRNSDRPMNVSAPRTFVLQVGLNF